MLRTLYKPCSKSEYEQLYSSLQDLQEWSNIPEPNLNASGSQPKHIQKLG